VISSPAAAGSRELAEVLKDFATLLGSDQAVYLRLGPEGAVMSVKGRGTFAFGESVGPRWYGMTPDERVRAVLEWIAKAARYCRKPRVRWLPA
jgi:hypothetical protein